MASSTATILIPDISGFTEFMTSTELNHGTYAVNLLIDAMIKTIGDDYEVSEIEGDALLLIRKGPPPTKNEIEQTCVNIFNAFHYQRKWMQQHAICPCSACIAIVDLTLKFVVHHGPVAEIKVGRFVKQSGPEMIVAHRLLKNSIANNEYMLVTEKLLHQLAAPPSDDLPAIPWTSASEVYASIGKIDYHFALLNNARKNTPSPAPLEDYIVRQRIELQEDSIAANFRDVYMVIMDVPTRSEWVPDLLSVEQEAAGVYIGSVHQCTFKDYTAVVSPRQMLSTPDLITYAEQWTIDSMNLQFMLAFQFRKMDDQCLLTCCVTDDADADLAKVVDSIPVAQIPVMIDKLKQRCEQMGVPFSELFFDKR